AAKASDRALPDRTRSWTSSSTDRNSGEVTRPFSRSSDWTSGMPAFSSVASSWLKTRNSRVLRLRRWGRRSERPAIAPFGWTERTKRPFSSNSWRRRVSLSATYTPSTISPLGDASRQRNSTGPNPNCINNSHGALGVKTGRAADLAGVVAQDFARRYRPTSFRMSATYFCVSGYGGMPPKRLTAPSPALYAASASFNSYRSSSDFRYLM